MTNIIKLIKIPDYITLANAACGVGAIAAAINDQLSLAAILLLFGVLFDYLDGAVARVLKSKHSFGAHLDSLSDTISFGVAPAIIGYTLGLNTWVYLSILILFVLMGVLRLARFAELKDKFVDKYFIGMPITINGLIFPILFLVEDATILHIPLPVLGALYLASGLLMISTIKVMKLR